jgi:hypothetical protein
MYSTLFYTLSMLLIITTKPVIMFDAGGSPRPFGLGTQKTLFSLGAVTVALAVMSYYVFALIDASLS